MNAKTTFILFIIFFVFATGGVLLVKTRYNFQAGPRTGSSIETTTPPVPTPAGEYLAVYSPAFENFGFIPSRYTCDGQNIHPPLSFSRIPLEAKSLALIVDDVDAPGGSFVHWVVWNIPVGAGDIGEGELPAGAVQGLTGFGSNRYGGPCPPASQGEPASQQGEPAGEHRYFFKVYALDTELALPSVKKKEDLEKAMTGHILIQSQFVGVYARNVQ